MGIYNPKKRPIEMTHDELQETINICNRFITELREEADDKSLTTAEQERAKSQLDQQIDIWAEYETATILLETDFQQLRNDGSDRSHLTSWSS